jgi:hypothetical protein
MANLLIGSSNITRHYKPENHKEARIYNTLKCTSAGAFKAQMVGLDKNASFVLISVIENLIADHVGGAEKIEEIEGKIGESIKGFVELLITTASRLPQTRFGVVLPLGRPALGWYHTRTEDISKYLVKTLQQAAQEKKLINVAKIDCVSKVSQQFEPDQIHLTEPSAKIFMDVVLDQAEDFFEADLVDLAEEEEGEVSDVRELEKRLDKLEKELKLQKKTNLSNNLTFARIREEVDTTSNKAKEDRLIINGLTSKKPLPTEMKPRIEALKAIAQGLFVFLIPGFDGIIKFVSQGKVQATTLPIIEVKLDKEENAAMIRKAFAEKRRKNQLTDEMKNLFITNVSTLATRVRIDVLKSIARKISNDKEMAYVSGFVSRPMMHIKKLPATQNSKPLKSFTFIDSVSKFGNLVEAKDLTAAYFRAGRAFDGQLEQNFVLLNDEGQAMYKAGLLPDSERDDNRGKWNQNPGGSGTSRGGQGSKGKKRQGEDLGRTNNSNKKHYGY